MDVEFVHSSTYALCIWANEYGIAVWSFPFFMRNAVAFLITSSHLYVCTVSNSGTASGRTLSVRWADRHFRQCVAS